MNNRVHASIQRVSSSADDAGKANIAFRLLVDAVQDYAIFILDPEGRVLTWNSGARAIKGYTREEMLASISRSSIRRKRSRAPGPNAN